MKPRCRTSPPPSPPSLSYLLHPLHLVFHIFTDSYLTWISFPHSFLLSYRSPLRSSPLTLFLRLFFFCFCFVFSNTKNIQTQSAHSLSVWLSLSELKACKGKMNTPTLFSAQLGNFTLTISSPSLSLSLLQTHTHTR